MKGKPLTKKCLVTRCKGRRGEDEIFCRMHWFALPGRLRDDIWAAHANRDRIASLELIRKACEVLGAARE